jgi:hypothetical protein
MIFGVLFTIGVFFVLLGCGKSEPKMPDKAGCYSHLAGLANNFLRFIVALNIMIKQSILQIKILTSVGVNND